MGPCFRRDDEEPQYPHFDPPRSPAPRRPRSRDLPRDIVRYLVGVGVGGVVRGQHHLGMGPERAVGRQRLGTRTRRATRRPACRRPGRQDIGFVLQPAAAGIDQDRRRRAGWCGRALRKLAVQDMPRVRRQRQQADQDVGPPQKRVELRFAVKAVDARDRLGAAAPARDAKAERSAPRPRLPEHAEPHDADRVAPAAHCSFGAQSFSRWLSADRAPGDDASAHAARHIRSCAW